MKRIIISLVVIGAISAVVITATGALFGDTETSSGNTFIAGAIDLKVDNECILNGQVLDECTWQTPKDLDGQAIFNFIDVKPGDVGEDTISLHVDTNPAWVCAEISSVAQKENGCNSPEAKVDETCDNPGVGEGELWDNLTFSLWMDDGVGGGIACNNIKDGEETYLVENVKASDLQWPIADSQNGGVPISDTCIGVAWSVPADIGNVIQGDSVTGDITFKAYQARHNENFLCNPPTTGALTVIKHVINDNNGLKVASDFTISVSGTNPIPASFPGNESGTSVSLGVGNYSVSESPVSGYATTYSTDCSGTITGGETKTCTVTNDDQASTLIVRKIVSGGDKVASDFSFQINDGTVTPFEADGQNDVAVNAGTYDVTEPAVETYTTSYNNCSDVVIDNGETETCTITNTYKTGTVTIYKVVVNNGVGTKQPGDFQMTLDGEKAAQGIPITEPIGNHTVSELDNFGYVATYSAECPAGVVNVPLEGNIDCTVTNTMPYGTLTVVKVMKNDDGGNNVASDFQLYVGGTPVNSGQSKNFATGSYVVSETGVSGYEAVFSGDCDQDGNVSLSVGDNKTCTLTNDDIKPNITLYKVVVNDNGGTAGPGDFSMRIDGALVPSGTSKLVTSNTAHTINEDAKAGYHFESITGSPQCPAVLGGTATLSEGQAITCTITNDDNPL